MGFRNNNPGNMRYNPAFRGVIGKDSRGFAIFKTHYHGLRAMRILLQNYIKKGFNTIDRIVNRYAPASDNNRPDLYTSFVSMKSGILANQKLTFADLEKIIPAMVEMETGKKLSTWDLSVSRHIEKLGAWIPGLALSAILFFVSRLK